ncbi:hypothetical protein U9M48_035181 [Paspalum notatum var. saurae]|uniref:Calponin-homology (CH) domain-containing protein n=1 Tax=Paspalum notatum var. saurae TaxID=547442 RepID=A0AAQ3X8R9_PASNO
MASPELEAPVAAAVVEDVVRLHGEGGGGEAVGSWRNIDIAWRKQRKPDLAEEPSEEEFRVGLRNGIILCNALNKIQPGAVPKVVEVPSDSTVPADGAALCAYQYFEKIRNFVIGLQDLGLPTFEASDLEKSYSIIRVVDCVLALRSFSEAKHVGKQSPFKYGGIIKPLSAKYAIRKNNEPFMKAIMRSHSAELLRDGTALEEIGLDFSLEPTETTTSESIRMLVQTVLSDKKPEEIPSVVEALLSKVINEFKRRNTSQNELVKDTTDINENKSFSRIDSPFGTNDRKTLFRMESPQLESTSTSDMEKEVVSISVPAPLGNDNVDMPKTVRNFDQEQKQIQDLKGSISNIKSNMEQLKLLYSEDLTKLGDHLRIVSHAASGYRKVVEENRKLYNQIQDLRGNIRVYCRVRPFHPGKVSSSSSVSGIEDRTITAMVPSKYGKDARKSFTFNRRKSLQTYNLWSDLFLMASMFVYLHMSGPKVLTEEGLGVNYRALNDLFSIQEQRKDTILL